MILAARPGQFLGYGFASRGREELRTVIDHYGGQYRHRASKPEPWDELKRLADERRLSRADRISILRGSHFPEGLTSVFPLSATIVNFQSWVIGTCLEQRASWMLLQYSSSWGHRESTLTNRGP